MRSTNFFLGHQAMAFFLGLFLITAAWAQTTTFNFQSKLPNEITPATGIFEMEVKLFDAATGGTQIGATNSITEVEVKTRNFTVWLDFGATAFPGADRFIEVSVRRSGSGEPFITLTPRTPVLSVPYAIRALNATTADNALNLGGVDVNDFVQTTDPRLSDNRNPNPGSNNYIQNTTTQQTGANFNIDGSGTAGGTISANIVNSNTQYNISGNRVLSVAGTGNLFAGINAGAANTSFNNSFFGAGAGAGNTTGSNNSFFGRNAGISNATGVNNSFFGAGAGFSNTTGNTNSFFGIVAGQNNTTGRDNSFVGASAGQNNTTGSNNAFFGRSTGTNNSTGSNNTLIGGGADVGSDGLSFATAIGASAVVRTSNTIVLGRENGSDRVRIFGLGAAGSTQLCRNADNEISTCSSSLRYKTNVTPFGFGLNLVKSLQPITFKWRDGGMLDLGFGAEDVAAIEPLLVTYNKNGQVEGVKYDRMGVVLINAVKEQQSQIEAQQKQIDEQKEIIKVQQSEIEKQKTEFDALKRLVCSQNPAAELCQPGK